MLVAYGAEPACPSVVEFAAKWPEGAEVTEENVMRAAELKLDIFWLGGTIFQGSTVEAVFFKSCGKPGRACEQVLAGGPITDGNCFAREMRRYRTGVAEAFWQCFQQWEPICKASTAETLTDTSPASRRPAAR